METKNKETNPLIISPPTEVIDFLKNYKRFFILGHKDPDGDCLGSQLSMGHLLEKTGAEVRLFSAGPFRRPEIENYGPRFSPRIEQTEKERALHSGDTAVLIMDCSTLERIGEDLRSDIEGFPLGVIDHHAAGEDFGVCRWIESKVPSVTFMVHRLFQEMNIPLDPVAAEYLFLGLCTDTGYFRHIEEGSAEVFRTAADLTDAGVSPKKIFQQMNGNRSLASRILLGRLLERTQSHYDGQLLITYETLDDQNEIGVENRDSDILYQQLQGVKGCEVVLLIREEEEGLCSVGLRSHGKVDVGTLAQENGGGGHRPAAGFNSPLPREELIRTLVKRCGELLE